MSTLSFIELKDLYKLSDRDVCFFSLISGSDIEFYDKFCVESGDFVFSDKQLNHTVWVNPEKLYEEFNPDRELIFDIGE
jgi:hypothetical protein